MTIKPYYQDSHCQIFNCDCRDILPELPKVDLCLTDPPYNVGINYGEHDDKMNDLEWFSWASDWFKKCREISETVVIAGQSRLPFYAEIERWKWLLCWYKPAAMGRSPVGFCNWEPMAMWGKGTNSGNDVVIAPIIPDSSLNGHPCPKPLKWATGFIGLFPNANTILDPFMGSGTTLRAAKDLNRKAIGIEIEERYCRIAVERLKQEVLPL